jgi:hypothetical protein
VVNTHVHLPPNFSAFETAEQVARAAAAEGLRAIGASNFNDVRVYARFAAAAREAGILPLFGLEIISLIDGLPEGGMLVNDPTNVNRMYLCGKGIARFADPGPEGERLMAAMRTANDRRMADMTALVAARFAAAGLDGGVTAGSIAADVAARADVPVEWVTLQERHVARAFQELVFDRVPVMDRPAVLARAFGDATRLDPSNDIAVQEAIRSNLMKAGRPAFIPEASISFEDARRVVLELGGIPCYPILADGASPICPFETPPEDLVARLRRLDIHCAELIPVRNRVEVVDQYVRALRAAGILVVAGTEHNTRRMLPLRPLALEGEPLSDLAWDAFLEATYVVAAHQALVAGGKPGYVDREGRLASGFGSAAERIGHFRRIGEEIMAGTAATRSST